MGYILVNKYIGEDRFDVYDTDTKELIPMTGKESANKYGMNFRISKHGKIMQLGPISLVPNIIEQGKVIKGHLTLIEISEQADRFICIDTQGIRCELNYSDYIKTRKIRDINNESIRPEVEEEKRNIYLITKRYKGEKEIRLSRILLESTPLIVEENHKESEDSPKEIEKNIQEPEVQSEKSIEEPEEQPQEPEEQPQEPEEQPQEPISEVPKDAEEEIVQEEINKQAILEELGREEISCRETKDTPDTSENTEKTTEDNPKIDYRQIIWDMYPNDRITIKHSDFSAIGHLILKILDSDVDGEHYVALCKIFKTKRTRCTFSIVNVDTTKDLCTIQVLGQSDIPEKALKQSLEEVSLKYAVWLNETRYVKMD